MSKNILAIGSHPDDVELGCGGALVKHILIGDNVFVMILTRGEHGGHTQITQECMNSLKTIGIAEKNIILGGFPDGFVPNNLEIVDFIERWIKKLDVIKVYTHYPNDRHQDHRNTSLAVSSAARKTSEILYYEGPSSIINFDPHYYIELTRPHLDLKLKAIGCYKSQVSKGIVNLSLIESQAQVYGAKNNVGYAEAFMINHIVRGGNDV
jgi:LmbE family N-acetylglucosaminyl deacetylase